jgi:hypothetical protein
MPRVKRGPVSRKRTSSKGSVLLHRTKEALKSATRRKPRRTLNGIPLKRKVVWVYDAESPEFKARCKAELQDIKVRDAERDGVDFMEAALADPEVQKWWR